MRTRLETDKQMSGAWAFVPLIPIIFGVLSVVATFSLALSRSPSSTGAASAAILAAFGFLFLFYFGLFIFWILSAIMVFFLVRRRNSHFNRQILYYEDIVSISKDLAARKNVDVSVIVNNMDRNAREARLEELEKNATLWAILTFAGTFGLLYSSYFLMKDFYKHERREDAFIQDTLRTLYQLGIPVNLPYRTSPVPDRGFALYFVLTLFTAGIFGVYWIYVLVSDPNNHFHQQMSIEDTIMAQVSPILTGGSSPPQTPTAPSPPPPS